MFFDTHCHLNFGAFDGRVEEVIERAKQDGVAQIVIPGTDVPTSEKAIAIAEKYGGASPERSRGIYAAVGIHPHHVYEIYMEARNRKFFDGKQQTAKNFVPSLSKLLTNPKVVAIGEVGIDRHIYQKTKYPDYKIEEEFVELQKIFLKEQIKLAIKYDKSLILHNREAKKDILVLLENVWDKKLEGRTVFHCCEPDFELLEFAKKHKMFIGVDGDITYYKEKPFDFPSASLGINAQGKQEFIKKVPLDMLVLETDSPFLIPELSGSRSWARYNEPKNIKVIAEFIAKLKGVSINQLIDTTTENAGKLFKI